jgi:hypothetical protein
MECFTSLQKMYSGNSDGACMSFHRASKSITYFYGALLPPEQVNHAIDEFEKEVVKSI